MQRCINSGVVLEGAAAALQHLPFRCKLKTLSRAAESGCEANVELAWQLLQPHVFPELLQTSHYNDFSHPARDVGSAAVSSGLAHLLPSLEQRCPGLLDPGRTLEAAARQCDLAGLQAAWGLLGRRLQGGSNRNEQVLGATRLDA